MKKNSKPFFSIIIPTHNDEATIERALNSIKQQSYDNYEIIIVNDASTDSTVSIIENRVDLNIKLYHRNVPGHGGYAARNLGIKKASFDWIVFLDADDEWDSKFLEHHAELIKENPDANFFSCGWVYYYHENKQIDDSFSQYLEVFYGLTNKNIKLEEGNFFYYWVKHGSVAHTIAICVRRNILEAVKGFPEERCRRGGDIDTWVRLMLEGAIFVRSSKVLAIYHREIENSVTKKVRSQIHSCIDEDIADYLKNNPGCSFKSDLRAFSNHMKMNALKKTVRNSSLGIKDLKNFYWQENLFFFLFITVAAILPGKVVRTIIKALRPLN